MRRQPTRSRLLNLPENRSATLALEGIKRHLLAERNSQLVVPIYLHGPPGVGKSYLLQSVVRDVCRAGGSTVVSLTAGDFSLAFSREGGESEIADRAEQSDLWILEDLQHLAPTATDALVHVLDFRAARQLATVLSGQTGPQQLNHRKGRFSARLTSRLAAGLVVALEPWQAPSRLLFIEEWAQSRQFALNPEIARWLAERLPGSGRILEGALQQLQALASEQRKPLEVADVALQLRTQVEAHEVTVDRILDQVSGYFRLDPDLLRSASRYRNILLPRQVGMYLARQLTNLSLDEIGHRFGGRDHTTVLYACRKVEQALQGDAVLSGAVRQLHAQLA